MANRFFPPVEGSLDKGVVVLAGYVQIGSDAAVAASATGVTHFNGGTITKGSTGLYVLTLTDQYADILFADARLVRATAADITAEVYSVSGLKGVAAGKTILFRTVKKSDGTAVNNSSESCQIHLLVIAKLSTLNR